MKNEKDIFFGPFHYLKGVVRLEAENQTRYLKIVTFGERWVDKEALRQRIAHTFAPVHCMPDLSIGARWIKIKDCSYRVIFWFFPIIGGRSPFEKFIGAYFQSASGAIFVFDTTSPKTLEPIDWWIELLFSVVGKVPILMIENKTDLESRIPRSLIKSYTEKYGAECIQTGLNDNGTIVEKGIERLLLRIISKIKPKDSSMKQRGH
jgi:hypothetical protein